MNLWKSRKLGLAVALPIAGLLLAPLAASAQSQSTSKCEKEINKNVAKAVAKVQTDLGKCVNSWIKEEDKVASFVDKGKLNWQGDGESQGLLKAAEKCQKFLSKIGMIGNDISTTGDPDKTDKSTLGKTYQKLIAAVTPGKPKCGIDPDTKNIDTTVGGILDQELTQLGFFPPSADPGIADIDVRLAVIGAVANAWNTQLSATRDSYRAFAEMGNDRCSLSGVACDSTADCDPMHPKGTDLCQPSSCPDCTKFARAADVSSPGPYFCSDNAPNPGLACTPGPGGETTCGSLSPNTTDFCDSAPSQGAMAGPCFMASCQAGDPATSSTGIELEGVLSLPPVYIYACDDDPKCTFVSPVIVNLANDHPTYLCDIDEVLPGAVGLIGGAGRGITALVTLNNAPVCVDSTGYTGYVDKAGTMPQFDVVSCVDVDKRTDWGSGAPLLCSSESLVNPGGACVDDSACGGNSGEFFLCGVDGCAGSVNCRDEAVENPINPGVTLHTGTICQDLVATAAGPGHGLIRNDQILTTGAGLPTPTANPCDPATLLAAGEPSPLTLTTHVASGNLWDAGPLTSGAPLGGLIIEPGDFAFNNLASGTPFDANALAGGALDGTMVSTFGTIATDPAASIGAQLTKVILDCNP